VQEATSRFITPRENNVDEQNKTKASRKNVGCSARSLNTALDFTQVLVHGQAVISENYRQISQKP